MAKDPLTARGRFGFRWALCYDTGKGRAVGEEVPQTIQQPIYEDRIVSLQRLRGNEVSDGPARPELSLLFQIVNNSFVRTTENLNASST